MSEKVDSHISGTLSDLDMSVVRHVPPGGNWRDLPEDFPSRRVQQIRKSAANGGGSRSTYYGRLRTDRPAYTINTFITRPGNGCFVHPSAPRLITAREAARLQSFPDRTKFVGPLRARAMQIGNAVPPLLAYRVAQAVPKGTFVDLFSGVGGLSMGFEWAGHRLVAGADSDRYAVEAASANATEGGFVEQIDLADDASLRELARRASQRANGPVDTLIGGPPCQGFSTAGPCRISDERNHLVRTFLAAIRLMEPRTVLMENVPALMWRGSDFLDELREELGKIGYVSSVAILHAEAYGVPQLRRRLFVQAVRTGEPLWPVPSHAMVSPSQPTFQPAAGSGILDVCTVGDAIGDLPEEQGADLDAQVALSEPATSYQEWARGIRSLEALVDVDSVTSFSREGTQAHLF